MICERVSHDHGTLVRVIQEAKGEVVAEHTLRAAPASDARVQPNRFVGPIAVHFERSLYGQSVSRSGRRSRAWALRGSCVTNALGCATV